MDSEMPALFKSIGIWRRSDAGSGSGKPDCDPDGYCRVEETPQAEDAHGLTPRSADLIGQARQQDRILFVGI